jgi:hypothetical protein
MKAYSCLVPLLHHHTTCLILTVRRCLLLMLHTPPLTAPSPHIHVNVLQVYEFRQYQLDPGYGSVPKLVAAFADG